MLHAAGHKMRNFFETISWYALLQWRMVKSETYPKGAGNFEDRPK